MTEEMMLDVEEPEVEELPKPSEAEHALAVAHEAKVRSEKQQLFRTLKGEAQANFGMVRGVPGASSPEKWAELLEKASDELGDGRFVLRWLGAERYLDPEMAAALVTLRQNLIAELPKATAAAVMAIDVAILAYRNALRTQAWIGNLSIVVERELFGEEPLNVIHGEQVGARLEEQIRRLAEVIVPLQDRTSRIMLRALASLQAGGKR